MPLAASFYLKVAERRDLPPDATFHLNLAVALAQEGRFAEARVRVNEALRLRPDYPQAAA